METSWLSLVTDWDIPIGVTCALVAVEVVYMRGWLALRYTRAATVPVWRLASFLAGLLALFVAVSSPLDTFSETLLFMHMAQHFVLMSVAPPLIVMGSPFVPILRGLPRGVCAKNRGSALSLYDRASRPNFTLSSTNCVACNEPDIHRLAYS
jgi:cytochrome c oxidase assembly factor CtaG